MPRTEYVYRKNTARSPESTKGSSEPRKVRRHPKGSRAQRPRGPALSDLVVCTGQGLSEALAVRDDRRRLSLPTSSHSAPSTRSSYPLSTRCSMMESSGERLRQEFRRRQSLLGILHWQDTALPASCQLEDLDAGLESLHSPPIATWGRTVSCSCTVSCSHTVGFSPLLAPPPANSTTSVSRCHSSTWDTRVLPAAAVLPRSTFTLRGELMHA